MKVIYKILMPVLFVGALVITTSCGGDDDDDYGSSKTTTSTSSLSTPSLSANLTTTTYYDVTFKCRFTNGGDKGDNMTCYVHWKKYASKQSTTPTASSLTTTESMRQIANTSTKTTFDKEHTGFSKGDYVYYYFECKNSKYTAKTDVTFCVLKN